MDNSFWNNFFGAFNPQVAGGISKGIEEGHTQALLNALIQATQPTTGYAPTGASPRPVMSAPSAPLPSPIQGAVGFQPYPLPSTAMGGMMSPVVPVQKPADVNSPQVLAAVLRLTQNNPEVAKAYMERTTQKPQILKEGERMGTTDPVTGTFTAGYKEPVTAKPTTLPESVNAGDYVRDPTVPLGYRQIGEKATPNPFGFGGSIQYVDAQGNPVIAPTVINKKTGETNITPVGGVVPKPKASAGGAAEANLILKLSQQPTEADARLRTMIDSKKAADHAKAGQNVGAYDQNLLMNHIGMTLGLQKGARITRDVIREAVDARSLPDKILVMWDRATKGSGLSPAQRQSFVDLATERRKVAWQTARRNAKATGSKLVDTDPSLPAVPEEAGAPAGFQEFNVGGQKYHIPEAQVPTFKKEMGIE